MHCSKLCYAGGQLSDQGPFAELVISWTTGSTVCRVDLCPWEAVGDWSSGELECRLFGKTGTVLSV